MSWMLGVQGPPSLPENDNQRLLVDALAFRALGRQARARLGQFALVPLLLREIRQDAAKQGLPVSAVQPASWA